MQISWLSGITSLSSFSYTERKREKKIRCLLWMWVYSYIKTFKLPCGAVPLFLLISIWVTVITHLQYFVLEWLESSCITLITTVIPITTLQRPYNPPSLTTPSPSITQPTFFDLPKQHAVPQDPFPIQTHHPIQTSLFFLLLSTVHVSGKRCTCANIRLDNEPNALAESYGGFIHDRHPARPILHPVPLPISYRVSR